MPNNNHTTFEDGMIASGAGEYEGLCVLPLARCMQDSSWDFPSFAMAIGIDHLWEDNEPPMHPDEADARLVAIAVDIHVDEHEEFIRDFPLSWDT